jgi:hypothetical protein
MFPWSIWKHKWNNIVDKSVRIVQIDVIEQLIDK